MNPFTEFLLRSTAVTTVIALIVLWLTAMGKKRLANRWILRAGLVACSVGIASSCMAWWKPISLPSAIPVPRAHLPLSIGPEHQLDSKVIATTKFTSTQDLLDVQSLIHFVSVAGMTIGILGLLLSWLRLRRLIYRCSGQALSRVKVERLKRLGIHLLASDEISSPVSCRHQGIGYLILPGQHGEKLGRLCFRAIVRHEFSHLSQRDHEWQFLCHFLLAICWWNPLLYLLRHRLNVVHEDIADMEACRRYGIANYASSLLGIARLEVCERTPATALAFNHVHRKLQARIRMLLTLTGEEMKTANPYILSSLSVLILALSSTACLTFGADEAVAAPTPQDTVLAGSFKENEANEGVVAYYNKQYRRSVELLSAALGNEPKNTKCYFYRAAAHNELAEKESAWLDFSKAIALDPKFAEAYYGRAGISFATGQVALGVADYEMVIKLGPTFSHRAHDALAVHYMQHEQFEKALEHAEASAKNVGTISRTWNTLAGVLSKLGRLPEAEEAKSKAKRIAAQQNSN